MVLYTNTSLYLIEEYRFSYTIFPDLQHHAYLNLGPLSLVLLNFISGGWQWEGNLYFRHLDKPINTVRKLIKLR